MSIHSHRQVSKLAGISIPTLKRAEADGAIKVSEDTVAAISKGPQKSGHRVIAENGGGAGVRMAQRGKKR